MPLHRQCQREIASDSVLSESRGMQRRRAIEIGAGELQGKVVQERTHLSRQQTIVGEDSVDRARWQFVLGQDDCQPPCFDEVHDRPGWSVDEPGALHGGGHHSVERIRAHADRNPHLRGLVAIQ